MLRPRSKSPTWLRNPISIQLPKCFWGSMPTSFSLICDIVNLTHWMKYQKRRWVCIRKTPWNGENRKECFIETAEVNCISLIIWTITYDITQVGISKHLSFNSHMLMRFEASYFVSFFFTFLVINITIQRSKIPKQGWLGNEGKSNLCISEPYRTFCK